MDKSNFDIIKCEFDRCPFWHIMITEGFKTKESAQEEIDKILKGTSFYNIGNIKKGDFDPICPNCNCVVELEKT